MSSSSIDRSSGPPREEFKPSLRALVVTVLAVAATYSYFLIFAQFGFLRALQAILGEEDGVLRPIMAWMGIGGIAGSVLVALIHNGRTGRPLMFLGFMLCGAMAGVSVAAVLPGWFFFCAAGIGVGTGIITVTLAAMLRREVGGKKLGLCLGAGTGLAYGLCNLPVVFNAGATGHAAVGIVACVVGCFAVLGFQQGAPQSLEDGVDYQPRGIAGWVAVFFALVWLDSAAFYVIQHTPVLRGGTWSGEAQLYLNAIVHGAAALLAGEMLDRRALVGTILTATALLVSACLLIGMGPGYFSTGAFCYTAGVSCYSTALVYYPSRKGRVGLAALVYAVAGWGGSALGIGMAKNLGAVPVWFLIVASSLILGAFLGRARFRRQGQTARASGN